MRIVPVAAPAGPESSDRRRRPVIKEAETVRENPRLSEILFEAPFRSFGTLAALPSNVRAIESGLLFASGIHPFVAVVGPSGWGKSHLLHAVATRLGEDECLPPEVLSAQDWIAGGMRSDSGRALLLDNVQDALEGGRPR